MPGDMASHTTARAEGQVVRLQPPSAASITALPPCPRQSDWHPLGATLNTGVAHVPPHFFLLTLQFPPEMSLPQRSLLCFPQSNPGPPSPLATVPYTLGLGSGFSPLNLHRTQHGAWYTVSAQQICPE